jgi:hypothetical protein
MPDVHSADSTAKEQTSKFRNALAAVGLICAALLAVFSNWVSDEFPLLRVLPLFNIKIQPEQWLEFGSLGLMLLIWGIAKRRIGSLLLGGASLGFGVGFYLISAPYHYMYPDARAGLFLLAFTSGLVLAAVLMSRLSGTRYVLVLAVSSALALGGGLLLVSNSSVENLTYIGAIWSLVLVAVGCYVIFWPQRFVE